MSDEALPAPRSCVVFNEVEEGDAVLYCSETDRYYGLNETGITIWRFLEEEGHSREALHDEMLAAFPGVQPDVVRDDVDAFLEELLEADLVEAAS